MHTCSRCVRNPMALTRPNHSLDDSSAFQSPSSSLLRISCAILTSCIASPCVEGACTCVHVLPMPRSPFFDSTDQSDSRNDSSTNEMEGTTGEREPCPERIDT